MKPWAHQTEALRRAHHREFFAYLMEMGTGKTKTVIDEFLALRSEGLIDAVFIWVRKGVQPNWVHRELVEHIPAEEVVHIGCWESGGGRVDNRRQLELLLTPLPGLPILVMNTEAASSSQTALKYARQFCAGRRLYMVVDESTDIKSPRSARTLNITELGRLAQYRRIMSGLPVPRGPLDMWAQANFLREGLLGSSYFGYQARYAVTKEMRFGSRKVRQVVGYQRIDELRQRVDEWSFRVTKEECLDLPPKVYTKLEVPLTDEQARLYREMREYALTDLANGEGTVSSTAVIVQMLRLQQMLCGHVTTDDGDLVEVPTNRLVSLMDVLAETDGKVIVWSRFRHDITKIVSAVRQEYGEGSVAQFHGGNTSTRHSEAERFMHDSECRFMVASYAGGHGNTWTVASTVVYYSNDFDLEKRAQSEDRAHRAGQTADRVLYVDLCSPGTVDERIIDALRKKINLAAEITGDNFKEWLQ